MSNRAKSMTIRIIVHIVLMLVLYILQTMVFSRLRILGIAPMIIPIGVVGVALFEGPAWGGGFGLAAGLMCDLSLETVVLFTLLLMFAGMLIGLLGDYVLARGFPSFLLCSVIMLLAVGFFQMFGFLVFDGVSPSMLVKVSLAQMLYSLVFILPVYYMTRSVSRKGLKQV